MRFIAAVNDGELTQFAVMTFTTIKQEGAPDMTQEEFLERLTKATTQWLTLNEVGQQAFEDSNEDFNFGDLETYDDNPELKNLLAKNLIFDLKVDVITTGAYNFNFDTQLWDEDQAEELLKK